VLQGTRRSPLDNQCPGDGLQEPLDFEREVVNSAEWLLYDVQELILADLR
jgi:hypothetical protein